MDKQLNLKMLEELTLAPGVSGFEDEVIEVSKKYLSKTLSTKIDSMLNLYIERKKYDTSLPNVMIDAHMDEVGFMVHSIKPNGLIKIIPIGGFVAHNLPSHKVRIRNTDNKYISGIITSTPVHYKGVGSEISLDNIFVDIGASSAKEVHDYFKIKMAQPIVLESNFEYDENFDIIKSKAFDCRAGCASLIQTMNSLEKENLAVNIIATLTSQEEVGIRGAKVASNSVRPDIAIVMEATPADDTFAEAYQIQTCLKKGPMLRHIDSTMITNPRFQKFALDIAQKYNIPVQEAVRVGGGTNAGAVHLSNLGVPTIVIGVPVRYPHTHNGMISYKDYENATKLATTIIKELNRDIIEKF